MRYAYVTYIMLGHLFISGSLVLAHSIRESGSTIDLVVLSTPDISKHILGTYFNYVIETDYIKLDHNINKHFRKYLELELFKFASLNLTQYDKIILISPDTIILKNIDHLFELEAPAISSMNFLLLKPHKDSFDKLRELNYDKEIMIQEYLDEFFKWNDLKISSKSIIHFDRVKPFIITNKLKILSKDNNFIIWHNLYEQILRLHKDFYHKSEFKEVNEIHKFYNKKIIKHNSFIDPDHNYQPIDLKPMWDDIKEYDYLEPIKRLSKYFTKNSYFSDLYDNFSPTKIEPKRLDIQFGQQYDFIQSDLDLIALQYIKCRKNMLFAIITNQDLEKFIQELDVKIYYIRTVNNSDLLYLAHDELTFEYRKENFKNTNITIIFFEYNNKKINFNDIYINTYFYQTVEMAQNLLGHRDIPNSLEFNRFKKWCYENFSLLELERIIILDVSKIKGILIPIREDSQSEEELAELVKNKLTMEKYKHDLTNPEYYEYYNGIKIIK